MKNILTVFCAVNSMLLLTASLHAQIINVSCKGNDIEFSKDTVAGLKLFTGVTREGKTYLHWDVTNQHSNGVYIIYRSLDGENYSLAGQKTGIGVPISQDIAYYFTDDFSYSGTIYYKLLHVSENKNFILSETIALSAENTNYLTGIK